MTENQACLQCGLQLPSRLRVRCRSTAMMVVHAGLVLMCFCAMACWADPRRQVSLRKMSLDGKVFTRIWAEAFESGGVLSLRSGGRMRGKMLVLCLPCVLHCRVLHVCPSERQICSLISCVRFPTCRDMLMLYVNAQDMPFSCALHDFLTVLE